MYFEEKMIDGILHFRTNPKSEFHAYSAGQLSRLVLELKNHIKELVQEIRDG